MMIKLYKTVLLLLMPAVMFGQTTQDETIKRSVTLYNPYKPTLQEANKRAVFPPMDDTAKVRVDFNYGFTPGEFTPTYTVSPIKPAALSPDPLPKLYKGFVNLGLGNYLTPFIEVSVANDRSKKGTIGVYTRSYASAGKIKLDNKDKVFAGFMDNQVLLYGKKYFTRSRLDADIDFRQMSRYAYGYDTSLAVYEAGRKEIRSVIFDVTGAVRYFNMPRDSSDLYYDLTIKYNFFSRGDSAIQSNPGFTLRGGKEKSGFYIGLNTGYDIYNFGGNLDYLAKHFFTFNPYVTRGTEDWRFRFGFDAAVDSRDNTDPFFGGKMSTHLYLYPDVEFAFSVIPTYMRFRVTLDGDMTNNQARNAVYMNPLLFPGDTLFTLKNTDNKLRLAAGFEGCFDVNASYAAGVSYTFFNDMLFFRNDTLEAGNYFLPVYDDGDILEFHGEFSMPLFKHMRLTSGANFYRYSLTEEEYAWHKPGWDASMKLDYDLRNKILASATINALGRRHALVKAPESSVELPMHVNLNLGVEYRYTRVLSLWLRANNISWNKYYEWNNYPAHNFMILGGFTYSL